MCCLVSHQAVPRDGSLRLRAWEDFPLIRVADPGGGRTGAAAQPQEACGRRSWPGVVWCANRLAVRSGAPVGIRCLYGVM